MTTTPVFQHPSRYDSPVTVRLSIGGMSCAGCVAAVENTLRAVPGVVGVQVNLAERTAQITGMTPAATLVAAVRRAGYDAAEMQPWDDGSAEQTREQQRFWRLLAQGASAGIAALALMLGDMAHVLPNLVTGQAFWLVVAGFTLLVMLVTGGRYYRGAWQALQRRNANMDTLVALGTLTAWAYSCAVVLWPESVPSLARHAYFESALAILAFLAIGTALEARARQSASAAIRALVRLQPQQVTVIRTGQEFTLPLAEVGLGETVRVRPGERIPLDGVIIEGHAQVDESLLTGESAPRLRQVGDRVTGGSLNLDGALWVEVQHIGQETVLAQLVALVRSAQATKPPIGVLADRIAAVFVPVVIGIALLSFVLWLGFGPPPALSYALVTAVSVLLIACPCALGLATPLAVIIGVGEAARRGLVIRNGAALQRSRDLTHILFDKTGTLTEGLPQLVALETAPGWTESQLLGLAASIEQQAEHPLARALVRAARTRAVAEPEAITDFHAEGGYGVTASWAGQTVWLGRANWLAAQGVVLPPAAITQTGSRVECAVAGQWVGRFWLEDQLRPEAPDVVTALQQAGLTVILLSGDTPASVKRTAQGAGITVFQAEMLPQAKIAYIQRLQATGAVVAMVGDGINDAPALAQADVGLAMASGTDAAIFAGDVTLRRNDLHGVIALRSISQATLANIRENLALAFLFNGLGIPLAAGLFYPWTGSLLNPMYAGLAMALSSLTVALNANSLRGRIRRRWS